MLTTQSDETSILERIKAARGNAEPEVPTEEPQIVDMSEPDEPIEEAEEVTEETLETEQPEEIVEESEEVEEMYLDLDGEEVSLSQVREWKSGNMMQSDYTRKTTEHAREVEAFKQEREAFNANQAKLNEQLSTLEAVIQSDELSTDELNELREYEPEQYIKHIEKQNKRKAILEEGRKAQVETPKVNVQQEQQKLLNNNPHWVENGQFTKAYQEDVRSLDDYASKVGISAEQFSTLDATMMQIMLDAARNTKQTDKAAAVTKKVRQAPVVTKPKQKVKSSLQQEVEKAHARFKKTGHVDDAVAYRKLKAKLNNN